MSTIQLQSVGHVPAIQASEVREGDVKMYNFGSTGLIVKVIEKTPKTLMIITFENGKYYMSDVRKTSLVAVVKRDQDVSEHTPTEAYYKRKGLVDVTEYFQTVEVIEETIETVEEQQAEVIENESIQQIEVKEITFLWSESPIVKNDTTVKTFEEAEQIIFNIACNKDTQGYDKTQFKITWKDGHTYTGRIDVLKSYTSGKELKQHIEDHCTFFAGLRKAYHETMEEYENTLRAYGITEEDKQEYKLFLDTYLLEDIKALANNENEVIETIEEVVAAPETTETTIENNQTNDNEITYQTGTGLKGNGIEITFTSKPSEEVRNLMKSNGFRWAGKNRSSVWWAIMKDETISLAKQIAGEQINTLPVEPVDYPEINIEDNENYTIDQRIQDAEYEASWIFRSSKTDYNKELQKLFTDYTNQVKSILSLTNDEYYIYKLKSGLQRFKKNYHQAYIKYLTHKGNNPSWAVTGRGNLNVSRYNKAMDRQNKLMSELATLPKEFEQYMSKYRNKIKREQKKAI